MISDFFARNSLFVFCDKFASFFQFCRLIEVLGAAKAANRTLGTFPRLGLRASQGAFSQRGAFLDQLRGR